MEGARHPYHPLTPVSSWQAQQYQQQQQQQQQHDYQHSRFQLQQHEYQDARYQQQHFLPQAQAHPQLHPQLHPQASHLSHLQARSQAFHPGSALGSMAPTGQQSTQPVEDFPQLFQQIQKQLHNTGKPPEPKEFNLSQFQPLNASPHYSTPTPQHHTNAPHSPSSNLQSHSPAVPSPPPIPQSSTSTARSSPLPMHSPMGALSKERPSCEAPPPKTPSSSNLPSHPHLIPNIMNSQPLANRSSLSYETPMRADTNSEITANKNQVGHEGNDSYAGSEAAVTTPPPPPCNQAASEERSAPVPQIGLPLCEDSSTALADELESTLGSVSSFPDGQMNSQSEREEDSNQSCSQEGSLPDNRPPGTFCIDSLLSEGNQKSPYKLQKASSNSSMESTTGRDKPAPAEASADNNLPGTNVNGDADLEQDQTNQSDTNDSKTVEENFLTSDPKYAKPDSESSNKSSTEVKINESACHSSSQVDEERNNRSTSEPLVPKPKRTSEERSSLSALKRIRLADLRRESQGESSNQSEGDSEAGSRRFRESSPMVDGESTNKKNAIHMDKNDGRASATEEGQSSTKEVHSSSSKDVSLSLAKEDSQSSIKEDSSSKDGSTTSDKEGNGKSSGQPSLMLKPLKDLMAPETSKTPPPKSSLTSNVALVQVRGSLILTATNAMPDGSTMVMSPTPSLSGVLSSNAESVPSDPTHDPQGEGESGSATANNEEGGQDPLAVDVEYNNEGENPSDSGDVNADPFMMEDVKPSALIPEVVLKTEPDDTDSPPPTPVTAWRDMGTNRGGQVNNVPAGVVMLDSGMEDNDDLTHFFEDNEHHFIDGKLLKVTCHVCDVSVGSHMFKHHLFFGHLQCQYCNRKLVGCDMLNDIRNPKKNACGRSITREHCFRRWALDPIEFLSYYIRKELVIKRFCAGKQGPPPVSDIIQEIESYIEKLTDLAEVSPWKFAIEKCYKYISERRPGTRDKTTLGSSSSSSNSDSRRMYSNNTQNTSRPSSTFSSNQGQGRAREADTSSSSTSDVLSHMRNKINVDSQRGGGSATADRSVWVESLQRNIQASQSKKPAEPASLSCSCSRALTAAILKTVFPRQPTSDNYYVMHYPTHPVPDCCPNCYGNLEPSKASVNASTHVISIHCPDCDLAIYIAQDPPGTQEPLQSKRKEPPASSLAPADKAPRVS